MKAVIYHILAVFFIILGIIGIFLPVMPTVPFLLAALYLAADSPAIKNFMQNNRLLKHYLEVCRGDYKMSRVQFLGALILLWGSLIISGLTIPIWYCRLILLAAGIGVSYHLWHLQQK